MTRDPVTIEDREYGVQALRLMESRSITALPVTDRPGGSRASCTCTTSSRPASPDSGPMSGVSSAQEKARGIRWLVLDVDGVLTDGRVILDGGRGVESLRRADGATHRFGGARGHPHGVSHGPQLAGRGAPRAELGVHRVFQGARDKGEVLEQFFREEAPGRRKTAYLGDDIVDLPALRRAGFAALSAMRFRKSGPRRLDRGPAQADAAPSGNSSSSS